LRNAEEIELHSIDDSDYGMLESMNRNRYLDDCVSKVLATDNAFNLNAFLYKYIGNKTIVGLQYQPASR